MKQMLINLHGKARGDSLPQKQGVHLSVKDTSSSSVNLPLDHEDGNIFEPQPTLFVSSLVQY